MSGSSPLPGAAAGSLTLDSVLRWLESWLHDPAMLRIRDLFGWPPPPDDALLALHELVERSEAWDFRRGSERHSLSERFVVHNDVRLDEERLADAASALGLTGGMAVEGTFSHVVVLGGMVRACWNRAALARTAAETVAASTVVMLTTHRPIPATENAQAEELGWHDIGLESEAAEHAMRESFGLEEPPAVVADFVDEGWSTLDEEAEGGRRRSWFHHRWLQTPVVEVIAAPSSEPAKRRANTADQLEFWGSRAQLVENHRLLLVTTEHYVPFQQLQAARVLGLRAGCEIVTTGTPWSPAGPYRAAALLQELRSTLGAATELVAALAADAEDGRTR